MDWGLLQFNKMLRLSVFLVVAALLVGTHGAALWVTLNFSKKDNPFHLFSLGNEATEREAHQLVAFNGLSSGATRVLDGLPLGEDLGLRMLSHSLLPEARLSAEPRLPLPTAAELDAIAKVAQILVTLGQQVIPAIIGDPPAATSPPINCDIPNDPVKE